MQGRPVAVVGVGNTPFEASNPERTYYELAFDATEEALEDADLTIHDVESSVFGIYNDLFERQFMPDVYTAAHLGLNPTPESRVTTGGATGGFAIRQGAMEVASGAHDLVLVCGTEKCADLHDERSGKPTPEVLKAIAYSGDMTWEHPIGLIAASSYALNVNRHIHEYGTPTEEQMAKVSVKNHGHALDNPTAHSPKELTLQDVHDSPRICDPFNFYDCCLYSEGAATALLASPGKVEELGLEDQAVWIQGVGAGSDTERPGDRLAWDRSLAHSASMRTAADQAYEQAGITDPYRELDVAELHDAFTGIEPMIYEDIGLCEPGEGGTLLDEEAVMKGGELPVSPSGGLLGCGHPVGATGVYQVNECAKQIRDEAGPRQIPDTDLALAHSMGGPGAAYNTIIVLGRDAA